MERKGVVTTARAADKSLIQVILQKYRDCSVDSITGPTGIRKYEPQRHHHHVHHPHHRIWSPSSSSIPSNVSAMSVDHGPDSNGSVATTTSSTAAAALKPKHENVSSGKAALDSGRSSRSFSPALSSGSGSTSHHQPPRLPASGVAAARRGPSTVKQTLLDGIPLACFNIGGEKRLCYDQLLADVLKEFTQSDINTSRDHLKIYFPRCDEQQLEALKLSEVVPWSDSSCLLITKSDAYRLCSALMFNRAPQRNDKKYTRPMLDVYHECFGGCKGIFEPEVYKEPHAKCVTCQECHRLFSPRKFVTHSHSTTEIQTCHWGMDSSKWRLYLLLPDELMEDEETAKLWEDVKKRFATTLRKRKQSNSEAESLAGSDYGSSSASMSKRRAEVKTLTYNHHSPSVVVNNERRSGTPASSVSSPREHGGGGDVVNRRSAFRPWSPLEEKTQHRATVGGGETAETHEGQTSNNAAALVNCTNHHLGSPFFHPPHLPPFLGRNCSCPVAYNSLNGVSYVAHPSSLPKPVKTEYPGVICTQGIVPPPNSAIIPPNATIVPSNSNIVPSNAKIVPSNATSIPSNVTIVSSNATSVPSSARIVPPNTRIVPPNTRVSESSKSSDDNSEVDSERSSKDLDFASPERVKDVLNKYCHNGHLPSVDELSFALAKELRNWSAGQAAVLDDVRDKSEKVREEMTALRRESREKLGDACAELKCSREKLEHLNRKREEDLKEFTKTREALQRQVEVLQDQRSGDTEMVNKLMSQLGERDTQCHLLEKELDYLRSWYIGSQRRYPVFQPVPVAVYGASNLRDLYCTQSAVIQEIPMYARDGESPSAKSKEDENEAKPVVTKENKPSEVQAKSGEQSD